MKIKSTYLEFITGGFTDIIDLTPQLKRFVEDSGISEGQLSVYGIGSTTGITTIEFEPGLVKTDTNAMFEKIAPYDFPYQHNHTWGDDNGAAHLRSLICGTSKVFPVLKQNLVLGTWQQIVFIDFDTRPRERKVVVQLQGM